MSSAAVLSCIVALAGCAPPPFVRDAGATKIAGTTSSIKPDARPAIPLPDAALLAPPHEPSCEFSADDPAADARARLDYERQCYRHAETIVRDRLRALQGAVGETIQAVKRRE